LVSKERIEELGHEYLGLKEAMEELKEQSEGVRAQIRDYMDTDTSHEGPYEFPGVVVCEVKGRVTKKLDRKKLVQLGISAALLDAGTVVTTGNPSIRISAAKVKADAA
jgi:hypothetical protein